MSHRFFVESGKIKLSPGVALTLDGDQAHHAINVMRFQVGAELVLFDGSGFEHSATVDEVKKKTLLVTIRESNEAPRSLAVNISIAVALPKGDRQKFLIEKMVELGVSTLIPLKTSRSVAVPNDKVIERLKKQVVEACKQCRRNRLMEISMPQTVSQLTTSLAPETTHLIADPYCDQPISNFRNLTDVMIAVGPEGGFDEAESNQMSEAGFQPTKIGSSILRIETACVAAASILGIGQQI